MTYLFNMPDFKDISFDEFYKLYPRKVGRFVAENPSQNLIKKTSSWLIMDLLNILDFGREVK